MRAAAHIAHELMGTPNDGEGCSCVYYCLDSGVGLKTYDCEIEGYNTFVTQRQLADKGLAPECWGLSKYNGVTAYFTEHVLTGQFAYDRIYPMINQMYRDFEAAGFRASDVGSRNIGLKNGRAIMVDVGDCYTADGVRCGERYGWHYESADFSL